MENDFDISIITPLYKGKKYIDNLLKQAQISLNYSIKKGLNLKIEYIFINDFPEEIINIDDFFNYENNNLKIHYLQNEANEGIQFTRKKGILSSQGKYIIMLDQDDSIYKKTFYSQFKKIKDKDAIVGNAIDFKKHISYPMYLTKFNMRHIKHLSHYARSGNKIISPGQCLIKKSSIPEYWLNNSLTKNGSDDYMLWLLMLNNNKKFETNITIIYRHNNTGANFSSNVLKMIESSYEMIEKLYKCSDFNKKYVDLIKNANDYHYEKITKKNKIKTFFKYFKYNMWVLLDTLF